MASTTESRKQNVAVIGASGQVGTPLTKTLLSLGHTVRILARDTQSTTLNQFEGAEIVELPSNDLDKLVALLRDMDTLICAVPASPKIITELEPFWLKAAVKAGVKRFVPTEFGCHTMNLDYGDGVLFDSKKDLHKQIFESGIGWTFIYTGGIFDYFLPNLRFFTKITTFGNTELDVYTHHIEDIGKLSAMALTDDRTMNRCVQLDFNKLSQQEMLKQLKQNFPDFPFEYEHFSVEFIKESKETAGDEVSAKKGAETDRERWGINYVIYVIDKLVAFTDETLRASELFPNYAVMHLPEDALKDPKFVFDTEGK